MNIEKLRKFAGREEIDYQFIVSALSQYTYPRDKISSWLKSEELIRVKKGLYIFGEDIALKPYSKELIANLIYGPSAISLTYALSYYGLIPERVNVITSITNNRIKNFKTPIGDFKYYYLHPQKYSVGITLNSLNKDQSFLIATPEKALCDQINLIAKDCMLNNMEDIDKYLLHDLRIDESLLLKFKLNNLKEICDIYKNPRIDLLYDYIQKRKKEK